MIIAAFVLGLFILFSTGVLVWCIKTSDKSDTRRHITMNCLIDLVTLLNKQFPGSNLIVQDLGDSVKVIGELKYYKKNGN